MHVDKVAPLPTKTWILSCGLNYSLWSLAYMEGLNYYDNYTKMNYKHNVCHIYQYGEMEYP